MQAKALALLSAEVKHPSRGAGTRTQFAGPATPQGHLSKDSIDWSGTCTCRLECAARLACSKRLA